MGEAAWLSEAVVEFLKGPMYINPLMGFIDEKCLIFTPEEENKLEYTIYHNEFKDLVDRLLTDFLADLGVGAEQFYEIVAAAQETDQLTSFVVQTILTVDDFLMFKAMMVRRNIDLTNQVLEAVEASQLEAAAAKASQGPSLSSKAASNAEEEAALREALELSQRHSSEWEEGDRLRAAMRALQLEDEDVALPAAIAASLRETARYDSELADIEQAIALSLALEEERRRLASQGQDGGKPAAAAAARTASAKPAAAAAAPLPPVKGAPAAAPAPAAAAAKAPAAATAAAPAAAADAGNRSGRFMPAPIDAPTGARGAAAPRNRGAGFRSEASGVDLEAIRKAAQQAAESQKKLIGKGDVNDEASKWMQEAKKKLVAQKAAEREQEMEAYKAATVGKAKPAAAAASPSSDDAKRAALREQLAAKMRQNILQSS